MRAIRVKVSTTLIEQAARLPLGVMVWSATASPTDIRDGLIEVTLRSDHFAEVPEGQEPPLVEPIALDRPARREWQFGDVKLETSS